MTAQIHDRVLVDGDEWSLTGASGGPLFEPERHRLEPVATSTASWRGWHAVYALADDRLVLHRLDLGLKGDAEDAARAGNGPLLAGHRPRVATVQASVHTWLGWREREVPTGEWRYEGLGLPIPFTGTLLLGRGFLRELYVHMGFHPCWKYAETLELGFEDGQQTSRRDLSARTAELRERLAGRDAPTGDAREEEIAAWIASTFTLDCPLDP